MNKKEFELSKNNIIKKLKHIVLELDEVKYLDKTPMIFKYSDILFSVETIERTLDDFAVFKRVQSIRTERIKIIKEKQDKFYKRLELEGKELHEDYNLRTWTYEEWLHAYSWDE